ncbi:LysR family transcriptional regulator [Pseudomonas sp. UL073]|uniref:LysR family transcriptional regulator n=1 Tax=Zestomonas insulae TaxID=2809017 RepID=A0ABS2IJG6_9GAMM|nr:LysR family transcriptional regulator [Pseudomonas insulae]MBM7063189.1 LysR family transcriptional regulator [Pseudomonas insulae]
MNISNFDLNLLRVLDALLRERNVSRAAERLALSQPAVSNALNRLRELLDDPLLVRAGRSMQPTPRALSLEAPIRAALAQIEQSLSGAEQFDPARSRQRFSIAMTDYAELLCMPHLLSELAEQAPGISLAIQQLDPQLPAEALDKGDLDLAVGRFESLPERFTRQPWMSDNLCLVARRDHPLLREAPDLERFLQLRHLWVHGGQTRGMVDQWLGAHGLRRDIHYTTPNYLQAAHIAASTDLVVVLSTRLAEQFTALLPLSRHALPLDVGSFQLDIVSLTQRQRDAALQWLIGQIAATSRTP